MLVEIADRLDVHAHGALGERANDKTVAVADIKVNVGLSGQIGLFLSAIGEAALDILGGDMNPVEVRQSTREERHPRFVLGLALLIQRAWPVVLKIKGKHGRTSYFAYNLFASPL